MGNLDTMKSSLSSKERQLNNKKAEKASCLGIASDIGVVYTRLVEDKKIMKGYRDHVNTFSNENLENFKGNLYKNSYKTKMSSLVADYNTVIENIDLNMDKLNTLKTQYENKAYQCNGLIGYLQSTVNSLVHQIENWAN